MAAYAALLSLSQTTHLNRYDCQEKASRWEGRIRDLAHEAENLIEYLISLQVQTFSQGIAMPDLEDQLENVTEKLSLIAGQLMEERPIVILPAAVSSSSRLAPTSNDAAIGLDDDVTKIRNRLCGERSSHLQVIPIVGMGGIGKTTLATTVYNHASILHQFDFCAWITVSQDYNTTHSLRKILLGLLESMNLLEEVALRKKQLHESQVDEEGPCEDFFKQLEKISVSELEIEVFRSLKYRRYLIVMDDVWSTEVLDDVRNIFPDDCNGSRIMITTRLADVGVYANSDSPLHEMGVMDDAQSWNLLKKKVFANSDCPSHLEDVGEEIAKSCAGLPLTVVLVAGLLSTVNNTRASWKEIAKNVNSGVGKELNGILSLSYMHLPHRLRPCFVYLGGFPEDEKIRAATLIKLWVAEGFVKANQSEHDKSLEEEAEEYLDDFVKRNLVIVSSRKSDGKIKRCSLHDMVRDMCLRKAHQEKFLLVMDGRVADSRERTDLDKQRRISFMLSDMNRCLWAPTTHTILSFNPKNYPKLLGKF